MRKIKRYGCKPDIKDHRDLRYQESPHFKLMPLPPSVDLSDKLPACWDQGELGSCTGHGSGGAMALIHPGFMPSRLMIYYDGRAIEGDVQDDNGAQIRDVVSGLAHQGVCDESLWPYDISQFAAPPNDAAYQAALTNKITNYYRVLTLPDVKNSLAQGFPVIIGFTVYEGFESPDVAASGILKMPHWGEQAVGGHCVLVIGYDDAKQEVLVRNSWGTGWGINGNFWMPYQYFKHLVSDMWTIRV